MTGKTHVAIGVAAALTISYNQPVESQLVLVTSAAIGSLIPDLDHPKGKLNQKLLLINNNFYRALFYLSISSIFMYLYYRMGNKIFMLLSLVSCLVGISSHRSFTHSIIGFLLASSIIKMGTLKFNLPSIYTGFVVGYALHLIADSFNPKGIRLFYPIKANISFPITIKTNSKAEKTIFLLLSIYCICLLFNYLR
ncbi:metal-dependent hydrolase [Anaerosalibacter sp. Marseille-P3206]|uniref:metal-dependent hydrolase n=1 Tax=Anaerosalibacter sp. Marseille-P3206 TaxID=1871005 RepID=UPI00098710E0|nr:metal-dependent hydrolase [Anaerosalibacter sp. Marseille-P3206]